MISRNTSIPTKKEETFSTAADSQTQVEIHVLQGERAEAKQNRTLGRFKLSDIMPAPRGMPKIKVTFDIDANGILSVAAKDEATGKDTAITITANSGLSENDIERMVTEAAANEEEDKKRRNAVENRNKADQLCYGVEKALVDLKDKVPADKLADIESKVASLRSAIEASDNDRITSGITALEAAMSDIAQTAYGPSGAPPGAGGAEAGASAGADDDVIDAEFEETE